ncbi:ribonuclease H-like domain-containing protein [Tanacetum coccineum]|uniref:Ribonuclease H-like domain-containing protein n=1 Tax=Tanacetum coccineum TaxID=301880 RepID=A0ABQ4YPI8_9ASTR
MGVHGPTTLPSNVTEGSINPLVTNTMPVAYQAGPNLPGPHISPPGFSIPQAQPYYYYPSPGPSSFALQQAQSMPTVHPGASFHLNDSVASLSNVFNTCIYPSVSVGDGHTIPVTNTGHSILPTPHRSLHLNNILITPHIVKNLIYVHQFVHDNNCAVEFDAFGFSVKDFMLSTYVAPTTWTSMNHKYLAYGTLSRYKARHVANGSTQLKGVDVDETFSPVVKPGTVRTVLTVSLWAQAGPSSSGTTYLLLYLDDIVLTASSETLLQRVISSLHQEFSMTDLGSLSYFLAHMANCNPSRTPVDTESKLGDDVQQVCLHMHDPQEPHFSVLKRILRYVRGTLHHGLQLFSSSTTSLVAYSDADWAGCPITRRSTSGYYVFLGNNLLSWSSKRQPTLSLGVANAVAENCWLRNLLRE